MSGSPNPWAEALLDKLTIAPWALQEFVRSPYDIDEFAYPPDTD